MTGVLAIALIVLGVVVANLRQRMNALEARSAELEALLESTAARIAEAPSPASTPAPRSPWSFARRAIGRVASPPSASPIETPLPGASPAPTTTTPFDRHGADVDRSQPDAGAPRGLDLETLIAGKLPIWIGGAALVLAGFFLVRWSIDSGLLGPGVRTVLAAAFAIALVAASEVARRHPATADDPRIGQVLAGAGVASAYGTLYLAAALYDLIGALTAFILMLGVTLAALGLALRQGAPTAVMALLGGFLAPLVAGFEAAGVGPLLVYLGLFIAALFGLAVHRGWAWLALAATISGFAWINLLFALVDRGALPIVALFTLLLAIGATAALPATNPARPWLRLVPLAAGLIQLVALAPALDFSPLAWGFHLVLSAAALLLAWRDRSLILAAVAAPVLLLLLLTAALLQPDPGVAPQVAIAATILFGAAGHALSDRHRLWPLVAALGTAGPWLVALACRSELLSDWLWLVSGALVVAASAALAWRRSATAGQRDPGLILGTGFAGTVSIAAFAMVLPVAWIALPIALVMAALVWWADRIGDRDVARLPLLAFATAVLAAIWPLADWFGATFRALAGDALIYARLPSPSDAVLRLALPAAAALALLGWKDAAFARHRREVAAIAVVLLLAALHVLAKQPLAIATPEAFRAHGFLERALITQVLLGAAWGLRRAERAPRLATALAAIALVRFVWFDLVVFNPVFVAQSVGSIPVANLAVLHAALVAFWLWTLSPTRGWQLGAAAATLVAALALVRQLAHGDLLVGPVGVAESLGYSAAPLAVSLVWLWRGITADRRLLRTLGIALLTAVIFKVFLLDASRLDNFLRVLSFLGLGIALIGVGAIYSRFLRTPRTTPPPPDRDGKLPA